MLDVTVAAGLATIAYLYTTRRPDLQGTARQRKALAATLRTAGAVAWPLILLRAVPADDHDSHALLLPLAWNALAWGVDAYLVHHAPANDPERFATLRFEPASLTGLTFGLCGLLGARPDSRYTHLFLLAVVGCIVLVLPSHNLQEGCMEAQIFESVQKAAIIWCLGFLIAGVALMRTSPASLPIAADGPR